LTATPARPSGYLAAPLTTKSTSRPSQAEQRSRRAQSGTVIASPWRAICFDDAGLGLMLASLAPHDQPHLGGERLAERHRRGQLVDRPLGEGS
jgi:hypothetical protein